MADPFRARLAGAIEERGPLCAGIDPSARALEEWGLEDSARGAEQFAMRCLEAFGDLVAIVKPNVAFFEQYGSRGIAALESVLGAARESGLLTIADAKRGDIESTNSAYARAWLSAHSPLSADALTVAPYLGARSLGPFIDAARSEGRGIFVVVRSSNLEGREIQCSKGADGRSTETALLDQIHQQPDVLGGVIGLIAGEPPLELPKTSFYLVPGLWSQGATLEDLDTQMSGMGATPVVVNLSRSLAHAGPDPGALRDGVAHARRQIRARLRSPRD